ncbi:MAG: ribosomal-processing cysteine protease Prp [Mycoplasma sp.]|nr:ribosomal-processing cysteine protease Prp [Mycoplasma sp.]
MINITWYKNSLVLQGHANCNYKGKDLVCCAASAIVQTAIAWFNKKDIKITKNTKIPFFEIKLIKLTNQNQKYLELIYKQLSYLAKQNKKYISCKKK